jgi:hypothetical protein
VARCAGGRQLHWLRKAGQPSTLLLACLGRAQQQRSERRRSRGNFIRPPPHAYSDPGFEFAVCDLVLRREMWPAGPYLQRITRSPRSRPSLHQSASNRVHSHRTYTRMRVRTGKLGGGAWRAHLGRSTQATADQQRSHCTCTSDSKTQRRGASGAERCSLVVPAACATALQASVLHGGCAVRSSACILRAVGETSQTPSLAPHNRQRAAEHSNRARQQATRNKHAQHAVRHNVHKMHKGVALRGSVEMQWRSLEISSEPLRSSAWLARSLFTSIPTLSYFDLATSKQTIPDTQGARIITPSARFNRL